MRYVSTRGRAPELDFAGAVLAGLASDGGLYVPQEWPELSPSDIQSMQGLRYEQLACRILPLFTGDCLSEADIARMVEESYAPFRHIARAPLVQLDHRRWVMELFHGPTLAFKDFALQWLGHLLEHLLKQQGETATIIGATSGDTGSAAIAGCRGRENMQIIILHPHERVSEVQRRQMTTILDANVHNIALQGSFDDCQDIVKALFGDAEFRETKHLTAVNSINWARILAQVVYYFHAALSLGAPAREVHFAVPTGNFGDVYAGYVAKKMGLPIGLLRVATGRNDILPRFLESGAYTKDGVVPTIAPSIDIQVASNFERLLFDVCGRDGERMHAMMDGFRETGSLTVSSAEHRMIRSHFDGVRVDEDGIRASIRDTYQRSEYLLDPHTAVAVAGTEPGMPESGPMVVLATAHPAKFPDAVEQASGVHPALPPAMADLFVREERYQILPNDTAQIKSFIEAL